MPSPIAGPGEIVVDVHAASVNGVDVKTRSGTGAYKVSFSACSWPGFSQVSSARWEKACPTWQSGIRSSAFSDQGRDGTYAEQLAIRDDLVLTKPDWLSHVQAASVALTGITALWALEDTARVQPGETVLIHGAAGGVGSFAVQLAKFLGATVVATASSANHSFVLSLGADQVIDYAKEDFRESAPDCDVVFDTVGGVTQIHSYDVLKPGGRLVWIAPAPEDYVSLRKDVSAVKPNVLRDRRHLYRILALLKSGAVRLPPVQTFGLNNAAEAHRIAELRHVPGKLVLTR